MGGIRKVHSHSNFAGQNTPLENISHPFKIFSWSKPLPQWKPLSRMYLSPSPMLPASSEGECNLARVDNSVCLKEDGMSSFMIWMETWPSRRSSSGSKIILSEISRVRAPRCLFGKKRHLVVQINPLNSCYYLRLQSRNNYNVGTSQYQLGRLPGRCRPTWRTWNASFACVTDAGDPIIMPVRIR